MQNKPRYLKDATLFLKKELKSVYEPGELNAILRIFWEDKFGYSFNDLILNENKILDDNSWQEILDASIKLKKHTPIQHITGYTWFYDLKIQVTSDVLIPRPETEEILEFTQFPGNKDRQLKFLDIGTGSGCIALALKKQHPEAQVSGIDISEKAIAMARKNALLNELEVDFKADDILHPSEELNSTKFHLICSNPPYIPDSEKIKMTQNVLDYEPALALFVPENNPLLFYKAIALFGKNHLYPEGTVICEINEFLVKETTDLFYNEKYQKVKIHHDQFNKPRLVIATL